MITEEGTSTSTVQPTVDLTDKQPEVKSPVVDTSAPDPQPQSTEAEPKNEEPKAPEGEPDAQNKTTPDWAQKRINELTFKRYEAERAANAEKEKRLAAEKANAELLAKLGQPKAEGTPEPTKPALSEEEIDRIANERAAQIAAAQRFNEACNSVAETGKKEYKDWDDAVRNLNLVGALGKDAPLEFLETAIELKSPHKILHHLGNNIEEAERITKLAPKKMALELARIEAQLNAPASPAPVSAAPAPVIPVGGKAAPGPLNIDDPNLTTAQFMELRAKQAEERRKRYQR